VGVGATAGSPQPASNAPSNTKVTSDLRAVIDMVSSSVAYATN
jgi:hypothetical protein